MAAFFLDDRLGRPLPDSSFFTAQAIAHTVIFHYQLQAWTQDVINFELKQKKVFSTVTEFLQNQSK